MVLGAVADHKIGGLIPVGPIFKASIAYGQRRAKPERVRDPLHVLR